LIAQKKYKQAQQVIGDSVATPLLAVKQLLVYRQASANEEKELVINSLKGYLDDEESVLDNTIFCVTCAQIFIEDNKLKEALQLVNKDHSLELLLMQVQLYLRINRADLAAKSLSKMQEIDDDDALTRLAQIDINLFEGGQQKATEALEILEEMSTTNDTVLLHNLMAVANMELLQFSQAFKELQKCREMAKQQDTNTPSCTLINVMTCLQHLNKGTQNLDKLFSELEKNDPNHPFVKKKEAMEQLFDKVAQNIKV